MLKYIAIALLLLPLPSPEPRTSKGDSGKRANSPQLTATPLNSPNVQTEHPSPETSGSQTPNPNGQTEAAQAAQTTNDRIAKATVVLAVFSGLSFLAACGYIVAALLQWSSIKKQAEKAEGQLNVIKKQSRTMIGTWQVIRRQAETMRDGLKENKKATEAMQGQLDAMKVQAGHMQTQSEAMSGQLGVMENALKANRDSVDLAWEGLKTQKRAYLGTNRMNIDLVARKRLAIYLINVGKSPATNITAKVQVVISTPVDWHERQPKNVRIFALEEEEYPFNLVSVYPDSIPVRIGFPLGKHFTVEELTLVVQKKSRLTVNLTVEYHDGFEKSLSYFVLTYRGKDSHGFDSWGIFPTESEKEYDQTNPEHPEWKIL